MASHKQLIVFIILFFIFLVHVSSDGDYDDGGRVKASTTYDSVEDKVNLLLYYEALCPFCANFIVNQLVKIFQTDLISIVNLRLVPWGNTQIVANNGWLCQHGADECLLNTVDACAINVWPNLGTHFKFIHCIERLHLENKHTQWQSCFGTLQMSPTPIWDCVNSGLGTQLEVKYADETAHLNPPHRYVPWVLVNNLPLLEDYQNFVAYVCRAYRGHNIPNACKQHALQINTFDTKKSASEVCYVAQWEKLKAGRHQQGQRK